MKAGHAVIRLLCEFTITKWLDTGFNHTTSGIWHSHNCSPATSLAMVVETYQSFVVHMSGAIPLIIFKSEIGGKKGKKKNDTHHLYAERWHDIWMITAMESGTIWIVVMVILIHYSNEFWWEWTNTIISKILNYVVLEYRMVCDSLSLSKF